jgi:23S rRNA (guanine745-N1)-methyltransferase
MILSRTRFLNSGKYNLLRDFIFSLINDVSKDLLDVVVGDMGCGDGYYTTYFHQEMSKIKKITTYGIDLSKSAINESSKRQRSLNLQDMMFIIGNLNYIPLLDESLDIVLNSFAKIDEKEFYRTLKKDGYYIRILPGAKHLLGLKQAIYSTVRLNEEKEQEIEGFSLVGVKEVNDTIILNNSELMDLFTMTPYYYKSPKDSISKLSTLDSLKTEIEFKAYIYQKK